MHAIICIHATKNFLALALLALLFCNLNDGFFISNMQAHLLASDITPLLIYVLNLIYIYRDTRSVRSMRCDCRWRCSAPFSPFIPVNAKRVTHPVRHI
jgi:hypothetical protein